VVSRSCGTWQPQWGLPQGSKPTARKAELPSGHKMPQEAKAARRKATGSHNRADRASNGNTHAERRLT
jgi:hypothetical protein